VRSELAKGRNGEWAKVDEVTSFDSGSRKHITSSTLSTTSTQSTWPLRPFALSPIRRFAPRSPYPFKIAE
jgi:hypothetical protein